MSKRQRHLKIRELIAKYNIETQDHLVHLLREAGFNVTQATVSRDIKELHLVKVPAENGQYKYSLPSDQRHNPQEKLQKLLIDVFVDINTAGNLVVLKTIPGNANAAGILIDQLEWDEIAGSVCGDDTCLIVGHIPEDAKKIKDKIMNLRQLKIRELVTKHDIQTQEELVNLLRQEGFAVTQATISRDMKELNLMKVPSDEGRYVYRISQDQKFNLQEKLQKLLVDVLVKINTAGHLVVLKTVPGNANAAGILIDQLEWEEIAGTVCGDDTCLIIAKTDEEAEIIKHRIINLLE